MDWQKEANKARMSCQPSLRAPSFVNTRVIEDEGDARHGRRNLSIQVFEQSNEFLLALPSPRTSVDLANTGIESRKQMQSTCTLVLKLQANVSARLSRKRWSQTGTRRVDSSSRPHTRRVHCWPGVECRSQPGSARVGQSLYREELSQRATDGVAMV